MNSVLHGQLSNVQLELMKLFVTDVSEKELKDLKQILLEFKFKRATALANEVWEEKGVDGKGCGKIFENAKARIKTKITNSSALKLN